MSLRLLWLGNAAHTSTGYGVQTKLTVPRLRANGHKMAILGYYGVEGGVINWDGIPVFPRHIHPYGQDAVADRAVAWQADAVLTLLDLWVCRLDLYGGVPAVAYFPLDHDRIPEATLIQARRAYRLIAMSRFGQRQCAETGLDATYIPHMVDSRVLYPMGRRPEGSIDFAAGREEARAQLQWDQFGIDADTFVVGMVAANVSYPSRKAFHEQFAAYRQFHDRHPDSVLYVHSNIALHGEQGGLNLAALASYHGIPADAIAFPDQHQYMQGYSDDYMRFAYNAFDVTLQVTAGEGVGMAAPESAMCGTPVISGGWSAMPEHNYHGWVVPEEMSQKWFTPLGCCQWIPRIEGIVEGLEAAYGDARNPTRQRKAAQAAKAVHDADDVARRHWQPFLVQLERDLDRDGLLYAQRVARSQAAQEQVAALEAVGE